MALHPTSEDDGPVEIHYEDGTTEQWDRVWHHQSGMITLFNVERDHDRNRWMKGDEAKIVPVREIREIDWLDYRHRP